MREMKDSGIKWIGKIPLNWKIGKVKDVFTRKNEKANIENPTVLSLARSGVKVRDISNGEGQLAESYTNYNPVEINDLLLNPMDLYSGANCSVSKVEGVISPAYINLRPKENNNSKYYDYYLKTQYWSMAFFAHGKGVSFDNRWTLALETAMNYYIPIPPEKEQEKIANYLDKKILGIDNIIEKTKETIEDYKKYKQSIITEIVTKGLEKNTKMKETGVDWIKTIPENWKISPLKNIVEFGKGLPITKADLVSKGNAVISYGQIHSKKNKCICIDNDLIRYVSDRFLDDKYSTYKALKNDFIFADTSEDLEGTGNCVYIDRKDVFAGYHTIKVHPISNKNYQYLAYLFMTDCWRSQLRARVSGIKLFSITQKILKETTVIIPTDVEMKDIVKKLNEKCANIENIIESKQKIIEELEQYKKSLIYEYVTGKKEVI